MNDSGWILMGFFAAVLAAAAICTGVLLIAVAVAM